MTEREIFIAALQEFSESERAAFLRVACGENAALRQRIEDLLAQQQQLGSFLEAPGVPASVNVDENAQTQHQSQRDERLGERIGPYKLLQVIGEGGMGVVYLAEQTQPVVRRVALKIIKPGMDTRQVIARFEAERQALAMMDHPNIAKVHDAAATETGRPYFVMAAFVAGGRVIAAGPPRSVLDPRGNPRIAAFLG